MPVSTFADFVGESLPTLTRYAYALTGDANAAEDLVQDTLVKLVGAWRRVRHDRNPLGYARAVMFRTYVSRWRALRRRPALQPYRDDAAPGDQYAEVETRDTLQRALADLPRLQRAVLGFGYLGGVLRLKAGATATERLTEAPAHVNAVYRTGGWIVAAPTWEQLEQPDLGSVVSLSPDNGTTWITIPAPEA